ncbi:TPA: hypothetical protein ACLMYU_005251 [Pseudomonas aeruginosa]
MRNFLRHVLSTPIDEGAAAFGAEADIDIDSIPAGDATPGAHNEGGDRGDAALFDDSPAPKADAPARDEQGRFVRKTVEEEFPEDRGDNPADPNSAEAKAKDEPEGKDKPEDKPEDKSEDKPEDKPEDKSGTEQEPEPEQKLDDKGRPIPNMVPRSRMQKEAERRRAAEHLLEQQNRSRALTSELVDLQASYDKLESREIEAMKANDFDLLPQIRKDMRAIQEAMATKRAESIADERAREQLENLKFEELLTNLRSTHAVLDDNNAEAFDQGTVDEINELFQSLSPKYGKVIAMTRAVEYVLGVEQAAAVKPLGQQTPQDRARQERRKEAVSRATAAVSNQPKSPAVAPPAAASALVRTPQTLKDIESMSEAEQAKARGDFDYAE